jgi:enoyl-CoA hydratase
VSPIVTATDRGVRTVTLHRPDKRNALDRSMQEELVSALAAADQDPAVRAVVLTGADPAFCAGVDVSDPLLFADRYANRFRTDPARALRAMATPVIAAVNGACVSGGLEIALSCAFIVASEQAQFADTHARLGVVPSWGLTALLPRAVGVRRAREMSLTGRFVPAGDALACGLVNHVVPHSSLLPFANALAGDITHASAATDVLALYARSDDLTLAAACDLETATVYSRAVDATGFASRAGRLGREGRREHPAE